MRKIPLLKVQTSVEHERHNTVLAGVWQKPKGKVPKETVIVPQSLYGAVYREYIHRLEESKVFDAKHDQVQFIRFAHVGEIAENLLLVGLGQSDRVFTEAAAAEAMRKAGGHAWSKLISEKVKTAVIDVATFVNPSSLELSQTGILIRAFAEGLVLGAYRFDRYHSSASSKSSGENRPTQLIFLTADINMKNHLESELEKVTHMAESLGVTRDWSNEPSNIGTPEYFADAARKLARSHGLKFKCLDKKAIEKEKMGLFLGVNQGSEREPRLVIVEYTPKKSRPTKSQKTKTLAFVGKGVTFDTGGISIKPATNMENMKHDMTGAATVMGAVLLAAQWKVPNRVIGVMAFTENMPSGAAIQPGNVLTARNGKTVEVINTDAEGRLILGDALDYAQDFKPDAVVDVATLTGAMNIALGKFACGLFGNNHALVKAVRAAGETWGERLWELPLYDEYFHDLKSEYADMRNVGHDGSGGASRAAAFLKQFIRKGTVWAHLDIAGSAYNLPHLPYMPKKGAAGVYVRTLAQLAMEY